MVGGLALGFLAAGLGDGTLTQVLLCATGLGAAAAIMIGVRINRPARPVPWRLMGLCLFMSAIGTPLISAPGAIGLVGQALTGIGATIGLVGFVRLIRGRVPGGDRPALIDAAIIASGTGVVVWAFGFAPYILAARQSSIVAAILFYPLLLALSVVARMWFIGGAHRSATRLIVLAILATNAIIVIDMVGSHTGGGPLTGVYLLASFAMYTLLATAALHPTMAIDAERQSAGHNGIGRRRLVALTAALLVNPATLAIQVTAGHQVDPAPYLIGGAIIGVLVIARLAHAMRMLAESLSERESLMELLRRQALFDSLTSLPNRSLFSERLTASYANRSSERMLAVLLLDIDDFKSVNDSYGHDAGDALLVAVGQRLRGAIRDGDTAARLGGDEFVIALANFNDPTVPTRVAERVLAMLSEPFDCGGHRLTMRASIGVAVAGADDRTADDLVRNADIAMYLAKSRGKGRFEMFEPSMHQAAMNQLELRTGLAVAITDGELRLHFQPVIDLRTGATVGYEALVRWLRNGRLIPPLDFIPVAESSGLIGALTDWVLGEAVRTTVDWGRPNDRPWVSVNLSPSQLIRQDLVARLSKTLEESGMMPERVVIEVTESALLDIDVARPAIERLSALGVRVAIDDFGIGYSALSYLARLPIDIVKIDRSFVSALQRSGPEEAIAAAIIALARRLGLTTVGEGIETAAQLEQLRTLGCDLGQGFHLARPSAAEDLPKALVLGPRPRLPAMPVPRPTLPAPGARRPAARSAR
jgi:diguanylate cyclase (GGDEF)-like protein